MRRVHTQPQRFGRSTALPEARALYDLAGNAAARDLLTRQGADFRLRLRSDSPLREGEYALLRARLEKNQPPPRAKSGSSSMAASAIA
ncbi:MAG: hypothetical protein Kow0070_06320 [Anaerolineales bacterium]